MPKFEARVAEDISFAELLSVVRCCVTVTSTDGDKRTIVFEAADQDEAESVSDIEGIVSVKAYIDEDSDS
jgi:hypothetical protein